MNIPETLEEAGCVAERDGTGPVAPRAVEDTQKGAAAGNVFVRRPSSFVAAVYSAALPASDAIRRSLP